MVGAGVQRALIGPETHLESGRIGSLTGPGEALVTSQTEDAVDDGVADGVRVDQELDQVPDGVRELSLQKAVGGRCDEVGSPADEVGHNHDDGHQRRLLAGGQKSVLSHQEGLVDLLLFAEVGRLLGQLEDDLGVAVHTQGQRGEQYQGYDYGQVQFELPARNPAGRHVAGAKLRVNL